MWWRRVADPGDKPPPPPPPPIDEGNLKDQCQHIQDQIEELKELVKKNEEKQVTREMEVKKYGSILLDIKLRSNARKQKATSTPNHDAQEQETETPKMEQTFEEPSTPRKSSSAHKTHGNLVLLLKNLEQTRTKYELRRKQQSDNNKGIEEKLQHIQTQLDERDVQLKELQKLVEASQSPVTSSEASEDMSDANEEFSKLHNKIAEPEEDKGNLQLHLVDFDELKAMWWRRVAVPGDEPPPPPPPPIEEGNLKDQCQHIQDQIEELKELVKKNEEKQVTREMEVKKYGSILLDIKLRSNARKQKATSTPNQDAQEQETETPKMEQTFEEPSTPRKSSSAHKTHGNLVLLLKNLEQTRAKYELRRKQLSDNNKGIEEKLQHIQTQLDERDVQLKELQKLVEASQSPVTSSEASEDMSDASEEILKLQTHLQNWKRTKRTYSYIW